MSHTLGLSNSSLHLLSPTSTRLVTKCVMKVTEVSDECGDRGVGHDMEWTSSTKTGTVVLITLCGLVVIIVITILCVLNKRGKLDNML